MTFFFDIRVTYLNGEDQDPAPGNHVEEKYHGFIFMGGIGVKDPLGHHVTLLVFTRQMDLKYYMVWTHRIMEICPGSLIP